MLFRGLWLTALIAALSVAEESCHEPAPMVYIATDLSADLRPGSPQVAVDAAADINVPELRLFTNGKYVPDSTATLSRPLVRECDTSHWLFIYEDAVSTDLAVSAFYYKLDCAAVVGSGRRFGFGGLMTAGSFIMTSAGF
jgi:hypothetical protein